MNPPLSHRSEGGMSAAPPIRPPFSPAAPLPPPGERVEPLNLARRPFRNGRPVVRVALLLWLLGFVLLAVNLAQVWGYRERSADKRERIARSEAEIERQRSALAVLQATLDRFDLEAQNRKVSFLNKQIAGRTFSWSRLLDRIAERLPNDVRLNRLTPVTEDKAQQRLGGSRASGAFSSRRTRGAGDEVPLQITGEARNDDALLSFVDSLFKPPFADADLTREDREDDGKTLKFEISVLYRPSLASAAAPTSSAPAPRVEELAPTPAPAAPVPSRPTTPAPVLRRPAPEGRR